MANLGIYDTSITGTAGSTITTASGNGGYMFYPVNNTSITASSLVHGDSGSLIVKGNAKFEGDLDAKKITVGGINLVELLENVEQRLNILRVKPELESRWTELKELGERYRELEAECLDKEYIIDILKR